MNARPKMPVHTTWPKVFGQSNQLYLFVEYLSPKQWPLICCNSLHSYHSSGKAFPQALESGCRILFPFSHRNTSKVGHGCWTVKALSHYMPVWWIFTLSPVSSTLLEFQYVLMQFLSQPNYHNYDRSKVECNITEWQSLCGEEVILYKKNIGHLTWEGFFVTCFNLRVNVKNLNLSHFCVYTRDAPVWK